MRNRFNKYFAIVFLFLLVTPYTQANEISSSKEALIIAQTQKIYLFSILTNYLMIAMENDYKNPKKAKKASILSFEKNHNKLSLYLKDKNTDKIQKEFFSLKKILSEPFNISKGTYYFQKALSIEKNIEKISLKLQKSTHTKLSKKLQYAKRLAVISQKINALYLLKTLGVSSTIISNNMQKMMLNFKKSLNDIKKYKKIYRKLEKIYNFFKVMNDFENFVPTMVTKKSQRMLKYSNKLK